MTQAKGISIIHETVVTKKDLVMYPNFKKMGAEIELYNRCLGGLECQFANTIIITAQ